MYQIRAVRFIVSHLACAYVTAVRWFVFTNLYVACCGAALTAATFALLGLNPRLNAVVGLVFCCILVIYNLDRLVEPNPGDTLHELWVEQHRGLLWTITALASAGSAVFMALLSRQLALTLVPAGALAIGYCLPVLRYRGRWCRLKELPGAKLLLIVLVWTYATAGLPMLSVPIALDGRSVWVLIARFLFLAAVALPFDLPDMQRDRLSGIVTLPILMDVRWIRRIAITLALAGALAGVLNPWPAAGAVVLSSVVAGCVLWGVHAERGVIYFMVALDGMLLVQACLLWALASA